MAGKSVKNTRKYSALKRKGMCKTRAAYLHRRQVGEPQGR